MPLPSTAAMGNADNWVHYVPHILKCNRTAHMDVAPVDDQDPAELMKALEAKDPYEKRLKPISLDRKVKGGLPAWTVKVNGDQDSYGTPKKPNDSLNFGVAVAKSLQWPGAFSFYH